MLWIQRILEGRKVAVDASMRNRLIEIHQNGTLMNADSETTSQLMGLFCHTIRMMENGILPVYVFDGELCDWKSGELANRLERRKVLQPSLTMADKKDDVEGSENIQKQLVKLTRQHDDDWKQLLRLLGVPYIEAPGDAVAQCAALVKAGKVFAVGTEDMDALTFGSSIVLRHLTFSETRKMQIKEIHLNQVLKGLKLIHEEFIDLCILLGSECCERLPGIGPKRAMELIHEHRNIESIVQNLDPKMHPLPENWPFEQARQIYKEPEVVVDTEALYMEWTEPRREDLFEYLVIEKGLSEELICSGLEKLVKAKAGTSQSRVDTYFKVANITSTSSSVPSTSCSTKPKDRDVIKVVNKDQASFDSRIKKICPEILLDNDPKYLFILDSNILLENFAIPVQNLLTFLNTKCVNAKIVVPWRVLQELDSIKDRAKKLGPTNLLYNKVHVASNLVYHWKQGKDMNISFEDPYEAERAQKSNICFKVDSPDDEILHTCLSIKQQNPMDEVFLLTADKMLRTKSMILKLNSFSIEDILKELQEAFPDAVSLREADSFPEPVEQDLKAKGKKGLKRKRKMSAEPSIAEQMPSTSEDGRDRGETSLQK